MTREHRLVLSLDEIRAVRWQCKCGSAVSFQLDQTIRLPQICPACDAPLASQASHSEYRALQAFVDALKGARRVSQSEQLGGTLQLEFVEEPVKRP